jgi:hypothetical protein
MNLNQGLVDDDITDIGGGVLSNLFALRKRKIDVIKIV